jgi:hypothetical protein
MKQELKNINLIKKALSLFAVCGGIALAIGALAYAQLNRQIAVGQNNDQVIISLVQTARINVLLHELNRGNLDAKKFLNRELAANLKTLKAIAPIGDAATQQSAAMVADHITRDEKRHPADYLVATAHKSL